MTEEVAIKGAQARTEALAIQVGDNGFTLAGLAEVFVQSGFFKGVTGQAQAIVKVLYGKELGLTPIQSMLAIHMVEGRPEVAAATLGAIIKRSGKYDYRVKEHTREVCEIEFLDVRNGEKVVGVSRFDQQDAETAGLANRPNHKSYPKNMKFARAMSNGVKWYCLDAVGNVPVYTEGEIREEREALGEPTEPEPRVEDEFRPTRTAPDPAEEKLPADGMPLGSTPAPEPVTGSQPTKKRTRRVDTPHEAGTTESAEKSTGAGEAAAGVDGDRQGVGAAAAAAETPTPVQDSPKPVATGREAPLPVQEAQASPPQASPEAARPPVETPPGSGSSAAPVGTITFIIGKGTSAARSYTTAGFTQEQMVKSFELCAALDKKKGRGTSKALLKKLLNLDTRLQLTAETGAQYLAAVEKELKA